MNRDELVTSALGLARQFAVSLARKAKQAKRGDVADDWYQEACLVLCSAAEDFIAFGRPVDEWPKYASVRIRHRLTELCVTPDVVSMSHATAFRCNRGESTNQARQVFRMQSESEQVKPEHATTDLVGNRAIEASEASLRVWALIEKAQLADADRDAIKLHYLDGLTHTEVAEAMGWTLYQTRQRISRSLARMRDVERGQMVF